MSNLFVFRDEHHDLQSCIDDIREIPTAILKTYGFLPEGLDGYYKIVFEAVLNFNTAVCDWYEFLILGRKELQNHLISPYRPHAEFSLARLKVAQQILLRVESLQVEIPSASDWWVVMECENYLETFHRNGLLGSFPIDGKTKAMNQLVKNLNTLEDSSKFVKPLSVIESRLDNKYGKGNWYSKPFRKMLWANSALEHSGIILAAVDIDFKYQYWLESIKVQKRCARWVKNCRDLKVFQIQSNGKLWIGGKGKRRKQK